MKFLLRVSKRGMISTAFAVAINEPAETRLITLVRLLRRKLCTFRTVTLTLLAPNNQADNLITTDDVKFHARVRTLLSNSFTEDSLRTQHPLIHHHADMLISKLHDLAAAPKSLSKGALINMTDWLNFFTMDVIGDLAFGEPFGCLETGQYHSWVRTLFSYLKGMSLAAAPRYYPSTEFLFSKLIPESVLEGQRRHTQYANERINRRLDLKTDRPDFMTPFMKNNVNFENMSRDEILSTFNFIIVGGSETTATTLTGIFNHLSRNGGILQKLCTEIRTKFKEEKDITIDAIQDLPYLEAVLNEGLRMCNPIPGGLPRVVPEGGDTYAGVYLPGGVSCFSKRWQTDVIEVDNPADQVGSPYLRRQSQRQIILEPGPLRP